MAAAGTRSGLDGPDGRAGELGKAASARADDAQATGDGALDAAGDGASLSIRETSGDEFSGNGEGSSGHDVYLLK
jgi:hypothetical protein